MKNHAENVHQKLVPKCTQKILLKIRYFETGLSKSLKDYFFFRTQSLLIDEIIKNKRGFELVTSRSSGYETSSEKFLYYLCII